MTRRPAGWWSRPAGANPSRRHRRATITANLVGQGEETLVEVVTDLTVTGRPAQFGRGMISDVGAKLLGQFADCLAGKLQRIDDAPAASEAPAEPAERSTGERPYLAAVPTPAEVEAIDLLEVAGVSTTVRRYAPYAVSFAAGAALVWLFTGRRRG